MVRAFDGVVHAGMQTFQEGNSPTTRFCSKVGGEVAGLEKSTQHDSVAACLISVGNELPALEAAQSGGGGVTGWVDPALPHKITFMTPQQPQTLNEQKYAVYVESHT